MVFTFLRRRNTLQQLLAILFLEQPATLYSVPAADTGTDLQAITLAMLCCQLVH